MVSIPESVSIIEPCGVNNIKNIETGIMNRSISNDGTSRDGAVGQRPSLSHELPSLVSDTEDRSTDDHTTDDDDERRPHNVSVAAVRRDMKKQEKLERERDVIKEEREEERHEERDEERYEQRDEERDAGAALQGTQMDNGEIKRMETGIKRMGSGVLAVNKSTFGGQSANGMTNIGENAAKNAAKNGFNNNQLSASEFKSQRTQLMTIVVKYLATKIKNSFPPEATAPTRSSSGVPELALDRFILILTSRLHLPFNVFVHGMIYLFRYMDIVYLLRYLNQLNNNANCNMQFLVQKLIVGCFRLALCQTHRFSNIDWQKATGLGAREIDSVVLVLTMRMNGKLTVKTVEILKLKLEILRFVKMVTRVK